MSHKKRERFDGRRHPVHVNWRMKPDLPNLRDTPINTILMNSLGKAMDRFGTRITKYSFQENHLHMVVEAASAEHLGKAMQGLGVRIAKRTNRALGRRGAVVADHYHASVIRTPTQMLRALVYVLSNRRHHLLQRGLHMMPGTIDQWSSARSFDGWLEGSPLEPGEPGRQPVMPPQTWLQRVGWQKVGRPSVDDIPGADGGYAPDLLRHLDVFWVAVDPPNPAALLC